MTKLLPAGSFKSVETMHSAQMTALTNEMMSMEFELDVLRRRTAEAQKELEVANTRWVVCWFFGLSFAKLVILAASAWRSKTDSRRLTRTRPTRSSGGAEESSAEYKRCCDCMGHDGRADGVRRDLWVCVF